MSRHVPLSPWQVRLCSYESSVSFLLCTYLGTIVLRGRRIHSCPREIEFAPARSGAACCSKYVSGISHKLPSQAGGNQAGREDENQHGEWPHAA
eukprot:766730-Hanusia_phi.AAC.1